MLVWMLMLSPYWLAECRLLEGDAMAAETAPHQQANVYLTNGGLAQTATHGHGEHDHK